MGKLVLDSGTTGYDGPPDRVREISLELYDYLFALHVKLFGTSQLDVEDMAGGGGGGTNDHSQLTNLDADDHPQYLNVERHAEITGNPHSMTPDDIGAHLPEWNANSLQGVDVSEDVPVDGQILTFDGQLEKWVPADVAGDPRSFLELSMSQATVTPNAGASAGFLLLPSDALVLGVQVKNPATIPGMTGYQIGTLFRRDAWGTCGNAANAQNAVGTFAINSPYYTGTSVDTLMLTALSGTFPGGVSVQVRIYFWRIPVWT